MGLEDKNSRQDFDKASDKQVQQRWYLYTQLSSEGRSEFDSLERKFIQDLQQKLQEQDLSKETDIKRERNALIEKAIWDKHYKPEWARGSLVDEDHYQMMAEHIVIVANREEVQHMQNQHIQSLETCLAKEGLYMDKGDSLLRFQEHFNERTQFNRQNQGQDNSRGR